MSIRLLLVIFIPIVLPVAFSNKVKIQNQDMSDNTPCSIPVYAFDNRKAERLVLLEEHIYESLSRDQNQFKNVPSCHSHVSKYLTEFERDQTSCDYASGEEKAMNIVQNPFLMFRLIHRIYKTLLHDVAAGCKGHANVKENVEILFKTFGIPGVREPDLNYALRGILRLHYVYGLNATQDLRRGIIGGVDTAVFLNVEDCAVLAKAALDIYEAQILAYQWLMAAEEILNDESLDNSKDTRAKLADVWTRLKNLAELNSKQELQQKFNGKIQESLKGKEGFDDYEYYAVCRGESFLTEEELSQRFCYYETTFHPYLLLNPAKIEYLSFDPVIIQLYDMLTPSANSYINKHLRETMVPGAVDTRIAGRPEVSPLKNRMETEILNPEEHPELVKMFVKEETLTGLVTWKNRAGKLIASVYNSFGHLSYHYDFLTGRFDLDGTGDRIVTIIYYLTDVELGGATAFPEAGVWATPVHNSAVFWFNLNETGYPDNRMLHGGCPVLLGTKMIATKWIYLNANIFKKPCPLHAAPETKYKS